jgi:hypothetical protein
MRYYYVTLSDMNFRVNRFPEFFEAENDLEAAIHVLYTEGRLEEKDVVLPTTFEQVVELYKDKVGRPLPALINLDKGTEVLTEVVSF